MGAFPPWIETVADDPGVREALIGVARARWAKAVDNRAAKESRLPRQEAVALDDLHADRTIRLGAAIGRYIDRMLA